MLRVPGRDHDHHRARGACLRAEHLHGHRAVEVLHEPEAEGQIEADEIVR